MPRLNLGCTRAAEMNRIAAASKTDDLFKPCEMMAALLRRDAAWCVAVAAGGGLLDPLLDGMHFCPVKFAAANALLCRGSVLHC